MAVRATLAVPVAVLLMPGGWTASAFAQLTTGTITGSVRDAQGSAVPGAAVTLVSERMGTKKEFTTDTEGNYVFPNLAPDTYTVEVVLSGFKTSKRAGVTVSPGDRVTVPVLVLEVGGLEEVVQVTGESPLIQARSGERSFTVDTDAVQNLPIQGRSFTQLAALAPGVTGTSRIGD